MTFRITYIKPNSEIFTILTSENGIVSNAYANTYSRNGYKFLKLEILIDDEFKEVKL